MLTAWHKEIEEMYEQMVAWRRHLHENPELSYEEVETPQMIAQILEGYGIPVRTKVGGRGVVGKIEGAKPGPTIALRADFDALPIQDEKDVSYKSKVDGVMHACGHDGHTATLLAVAKVLNQHKDELAGNVILLHQHAEESSPGGASEMIADGCLDGVDYVFGTHLMSGLPVGTYNCTKGYAMASIDAFELKIQGKGGHGAMPHETIDAVVVGAQVINQLQSIISRRIDPIKPAVITVGSFHAGNASNVIADTAQLSATIRTFDKDVRQSIEHDIKQVIKHVSASYGATYELKYENGFPSLYNHELETDNVIQSITSTIEGIQFVDSPPSMASEDFAYYVQKVPGAFFFTGGRNEAIGASYPHHHPKFDFDERAMIYAGKGLLSVAYKYLVETVKDSVEIH
ncbi:amidohydrolase [Psychrobacillus glaciei]|uniref:Amidohydrolase n=1 Tax=Psychrobacillus glaciei TaxID=2283160 RepID=A0A5J6SJM1_9BACI|nr:M20 family metallopeptidase [Psychrobacillus glaciei]QFF97613.1 amidohydrolase [Psychrobacillus glaciei]